MFKKIDNMPTSITKRDIQKWIDSFCSFAEKYLQLTVSDFSWNLVLVFSDDVKRLPYNLKTIDEAKEEFKKKYNIDKNDLKKVSSLKELNGLADKIFSDNARIQGEEWYSEIKNDIEDILNSTIDIKSKYGSYIAGEYYHSELYGSKVILYNKVIAKEASASKTLEKAYREVFIHEFFHAFHYYYSNNKRKEEIIYRNDYTSNVIKESLASYFEFNYCSAQHIYTDIQYDWKHNEPAVYPYSGAKYIIDWNNFLQLLNSSIIDMDATLRLLLPVDKFYDVKNLLIYRIKKCQIPPKKKKTTNKSIPPLYLEWKEVYHSFRTVSKHPSNIVINNQSCEITYSGDGISVKEEKTINTNTYSKLIDLFKRNKDLLSNSSVPSFRQFPTGGVGEFRYRFDGKESFIGIPTLFGDNLDDHNSRVEEAQKEYWELIDTIIKQSTAKPKIVRGKKGSAKNGIMYKGDYYSCRDYVLVAIKDYIINTKVQSLADLLSIFPSIATLSHSVKDEKNWSKEEISLPSGEIIKITKQVGRGGTMSPNRDINNIQRKLEGYGIK